MNRQNYLNDLIERANKEKVEELPVLRVFLNAYDKHKRLYGSFAMLKDNEYQTKMEERYKYMYQKGLEEIESMKMERKYGFKGGIKDLAGMTTCHLDEE
jgi:hypothetical protein